MKLSEAWELYKGDKRLLGYSLYTLKGYGIQARLLIRYLDDVDIEGINFVQLKQYLAAQTHLKPASIGHRIRFIKSLFRWAQDEGIITANPASKLREPKMGIRVPKPLPEEDLESLVICCQTPREHALVELIFSTGCRIGEIYKLNRGDIDWETRSIIVNGKGDKERECYFSTRAGIWLKKYLKIRNDDHKALFVTERRPFRRVSISRLRDVIKGAAARAEIQTSVYPHRLRHSYACHLLENGAPLELIQSLMGHAKMETTRIYAALSGPRRREMYRRYF